MFCVCAGGCWEATVVAAVRLSIKLLVAALLLAAVAELVPLPEPINKGELEGTVLEVVVAVAVAVVTLEPAKPEDDVVVVADADVDVALVVVLALLLLAL